jgi:hypothetical protein
MAQQTQFKDTNISNEDCDISSSVINDYVNGTIGKLYDFTEFTFTNCGATGVNGPSIEQMRANYTAGWTRSNYLNVINGIQYWTVPENGSYNLIAAGAAGGDGLQTTGVICTGGRGVVVRSYVNLNKGDLLKILVGQKGSSGFGGGGGGGTFISYAYDNKPLLIAGGGGGGAVGGNDSRYTPIGNTIFIPGFDATVSKNGVSGNVNVQLQWDGGAGGTNGYGGFRGYGGGRGGGGFIGNGEDGASSFINGGIGQLNLGGFGGGGNSGGGGGGGGGYSGGGGGGGIKEQGGGGGGGGGSYDINGPGNIAKLYRGGFPSSITTSSMSGYNVGNGFVFIKSGLPLNSVAPIISSLVAYWDFGDASSYSGSGTTLNDISGQENTLTFSATPTYNASPPSMPFTTSLSATSSTAKSIYDFRANGLTMEVLFNHNGNTTNGFRVLSSIFNSASTYDSSYRTSFWAGQEIAYFGVGGQQYGYTNENGSNPIPLNGWTHFVITCSSWTGPNAIINTYLNRTNTCTNQSQSSSIDFDSTNIPYFFGLGRQAWQPTGFIGNIAIARIYNRVLSASEITTNYNSIRTMPGNPYNLTP